MNFNHLIEEYIRAIINGVDPNTLALIWQNIMDTVNGEIERRKTDNEVLSKIKEK